MDPKQSIDAAVDAHTKWFTRLRMAIETGSSDFKPETVRPDNLCDFGKWLYHEYPSAIKNDPLYPQIKQLHAEFHRQAAEILGLAISGKKTEAQRLLEDSSKIRKTSLDLITALRTLKAQV